MTSEYYSQIILRKIMDTKTFNQNCELDKGTKRSVRANPKPLAALPKEAARTGAGEIYDPAKVYFFFDKETRKVRESTGLRQIDSDYVGSFCLRFVIANLRTNRDDALSDGQAFLKKRVAKLNKLIADFELEKSTANRSLKIYLSARDSSK